MVVVEVTAVLKYMGRGEGINKLELEERLHMTEAGLVGAN